MLLNHHIAIALAHERRNELLSEATAWRRARAARQARRGRGSATPSATPLPRPVAAPATERVDARVAA